nr:glycosyltransferase [Allomuricauda olearia]
MNKHLVNETNSSLIYGSGIELDVYTGSHKKQSETFTFCCVARLVYEKGVINYLEAARICSDQGYKFKFLLIGPLEENSKRLNQQILEEYSEYVEWLGPRTDIPHWLQISSAFVLPTYREGFSRVLLEACATGIPSITTKVPGCQEIIRDRKEGILVDVDNSNQLAEAMILLARDKGLYDSCAANAKVHVEQFSIDKISKDYMQLYFSCLAMKSSNGKEVLTKAEYL